MVEGLSLFLNITAGDLASAKIRDVSSEIKKMGNVSDEAKRKVAELQKNFNRFSAASLTTITLGMKLKPGMIDSANLDRDLTRIRQTAGFAKDETDELRRSIFGLSQLRGTNTGDLMGGLEVLSSKNLNFEETKNTIGAINEAMAVTKASSVPLASSLTIAAQSFDMDLSKPGMALLILEQMTVAGRKGGLEIEDMAEKLPVFAANAKAAGFSFSKTVALAEAFSKYEPNKDKLGTLVDSTLRLWTNGNYLKAAQKNSGVKFFDKDGSRRDVDAVISDMQKKFKRLKTEKQKADFIQNVFGTADMDTIKGWRNILSGDVVPLMREIEDAMNGAAGTFRRDMDDAMNNAVDQSNRLKNSMKGAVDAFSMPINKLFADVIERGMGFRDGLMPKNADSAGAKAIDATLGLGVAGSLFFGAKALGNFKQLKGMQGLAGNVAGMTVGKAAAEAAGVQPVFIAGIAPGLSLGGGAGGLAADIIGAGGKGDVVKKAAKKGGLLAGSRNLLAKGAGALPLVGGTLTTGVGTLAAGGAAGVASIAGGAAIAGAVGYGLGTLLNNAIDSTDWGANMSDKISDAIAAAMSADFRKQMYDARARESESLPPQVNVNNTISIDRNGNPKVDTKVDQKQKPSNVLKGA